MSEQTAERAVEGLVAYCGLYCGNCWMYKHGRCQGCRAGGGYKSCKVKACCEDRVLGSCAECLAYPEASECRKVENPVSKVFGLVFGTNRSANLAEIRREGVAVWAEARAKTGKK